MSACQKVLAFRKLHHSLALSQKDRLTRLPFIVFIFVFAVTNDFSHLCCLDEQFLNKLQPTTSYTYKQILNVINVAVLFSKHRVYDSLG